MSRFAINTPYLIVVAGLIVAILGAVSVLQMPVDMFPAMNIPVVVVATFYSGMPPEQIESDITGRFERFFTLASNVDHIESRSLPGVSLIKVYFRPGTDGDAVLLGELDEVPHDQEVSVEAHPIDHLELHVHALERLGGGWVAVASAQAELHLGAQVLALGDALGRGVFGDQLLVQL